MKKSVIVYADADILFLLNGYMMQDDSFVIAQTSDSYSGCYHFAKQTAADVIIMQIGMESDIGNCLEFMRLLDIFPDFLPALLLFEKRSDQNIIFTTSDQALSKNACVLSTWFIRALEPAYGAVFSYFHETAFETAEDGGGGRLSGKSSCYDMKRMAALQEIMRGCSTKEIRAYRKTFELDLRSRGYYLFFWELWNVEYSKHYFNKDVYNMMGEMLQRKFFAVIQDYESGEVVRINLNKICLIINAMTDKSEAKRFSKMNEMLIRLTTCGNTDTTIMFLSDYVDHLENLRIARDFYEKNKANHFFLRSDGMMKEKTVREWKKTSGFTIEDVVSIVQKICEYIKYDIDNPKLESVLFKLYFQIIKPSMSYPLFYYSAAAIGSELLKKDTDAGELFRIERFSQECLCFSSIEEQYDSLLEQIRQIRRKIGGQNKSRNYIVMETIEYIKENYNREILIPEIADKLHVNHMYLSQVFKKETGKSVINYLVDYRIQKSKKLLLDSAYPIYVIAENVGFNDMNHFSKTFKRIVGISPMQYRKKKEIQE